MSFSNIREILELGFHLKIWQVVESVQYLSLKNTAPFSKGGEGAKSSMYFKNEFLISIGNVCFKGRITPLPVESNPYLQNLLAIIWLRINHLNTI